MKDIVLVDATTYNKALHDSVAELKKKYFYVKSNMHKKYFGKLYNQGSNVFALGLLRIATLLRANGCSVRYISLDEFEKNFESIVSCQFDAVMFSVITPTVLACDALAARIKQRSSTKCYCGGAGLLLALETTKNRCKNFDVFVAERDVEAIAKILNKNIEQIVVPEEFVDYDILPLPLKEYSVNTFTTLGCPHNCSYCQDGAIPYYEGKTDADLSRILPRLEPNSRVHIFDSVLGYSKQRALKVCSDIAKVNQKRALISCDLRAESIDKDLVKAMVDANIMDVRFGFESLSNEVLAKNNRNQSFSATQRAIDTIKENSNIYISLYCAVGISGNTLQSFEQTRQYFQSVLRSKRVQEIRHCIFVPYPRDNYDYKTEGVFIDDYNWANYDRQSLPVYHTACLSKEQIWAEYLNILQMAIDEWKAVYNVGEENCENEPINEYVFKKYIR